jgi:formylglycine-generating enzyme required for sulfatase activity
VIATLTGAALVASRGRSNDQDRCGDGTIASGARCLLPKGRAPAPSVRVRIPRARFEIGPSDWEAEGRVLPRAIDVGAFVIESFELRDADGRAIGGLSRDEAIAMCAARGGRLPTEDEWISAAVSGRETPARYPWGDTGAVCRRAAWGLAKGPCASTGDGPDTGGAHPSGDSARGVHDLAGNVAEWVADTKNDLGIAKGGSWATELASDLRVWSRLELPPSAKDPRVGARCAFDDD